MDGKRSNAGSGVESARPHSRERGAPASTGPDRGSTLDGAAIKRRSASNDPAPLDWEWIRDSCLKDGEASYTLHDGNGRFLDAAGDWKPIWTGSNTNRLPQTGIFELTDDPEGMRTWFCAIGDASSDEERSATLLGDTGNGASLKQVRLKRFPIFLAADPAQSRIVVKAVADSPGPAEEFVRLVRFTCDENGRLSGNGDSLGSILGYEARRDSSSSIQDFVVPDDREAIIDFIANALLKPIPSKSAFRFQHASGTERSFLIQNGKHDGKSASFLAVDITTGINEGFSGLCRLNNALSNSGIALLRHSGNPSGFHHSNLAFELKTGLSADRESEGSFSDLKTDRTDLASAANVEAAIAEGRPMRQELQLRSATEGSFWAEATVMPLRDEGGDIHWIALALRDITREREARKTAIQQENLRSLGAMASGIAHDFNNLLAPILGFSELLLKMPEGGKDGDKLVPFLEKIKVAAQDGAAVVNRLREFYKSQDQESDMAVDIDLEVLAQQVKDLTQHRWKSQAEARGVDIEFREEISTDKHIHGIEPEIRQALSNLIINAVDAIEEDGSITLSISDAEDKVCIQVIDTGKGMPDEIKRKCQQPFYSTKGESGTGLGLSIVSDIVERHGGAFEISSDAGIGSTVTMIMPAAKSIRKQQEKRSEKPESQSLRVMLVDDEAILLEVVSELLEAGGHRVDNFSTGESAIDAFRGNPYDLVITDRAMPNMSGDELASAIKSIRKETPVIMVTGFGEMMNCEGAPPENVDLVLAKPVPLDVLNEKISELVAEKRS